MKVILDECIPLGVKKLLEQKGISVSSVAGINLPNRSDQMVLEYLKVGGDIFITSDRRMKNQAKFRLMPKQGVIYVRVEPWMTKYLVEAFEAFLKKESLKSVTGKSLALRRYDWQFLE
jgi:predicted nuclease of predicted toxin-antitoxin system